MQESLFVAWLATHFPAITIRVVEKLNSTENPLTYLHRSLLRVTQSVTGKWESIVVSNSLVMADVVAMDSTLPLKKRDSIAKYSGEIPKLGMEMALNERQMSDLDILVATNAPTEDILVKLFSDVPKCIGGIYERLEYMFLEGLSTGVTVVEDPENVGTGIRIDYGYLTENKFGVAVLWTDKANALPIDDIKRVKKKAKTDGHSFDVWRMDEDTFDKFVSTTQVKQEYAFESGFVGTNIPSPSLEKINPVLRQRHGFVIEIVDRSMKFERNGGQTTVTPWAAGQTVFSPSGLLGELQWTRLAEQNRPVTGVAYQTVESRILVSKYSTNRPLKEFTSSQARVVPVITNVDQIYTLDTLTVQA